MCVWVQVGVMLHSPHYSSNTHSHGKRKCWLGVTAAKISLLQHAKWHYNFVNTSRRLYMSSCNGPLSASIRPNQTVCLSCVCVCVHCEEGLFSPVSVWGGLVRLLCFRLTSCFLPMNRPTTSLHVEELVGDLGYVSFWHVCNSNVVWTVSQSYSDVMYMRVSSCTDCAARSVCLIPQQLWTADSL